MSQYKSAIRTQPPQEQLSNSKYAEQAHQLQEFFPLWKNDDLQSLLVEVGGDVELAASRISEGTLFLHSFYTAQHLKNTRHGRAMG